MGDLNNYLDHPSLQVSEDLDNTYLEPEGLKRKALYTIIVNVPPTTTRQDLVNCLRRFGTIGLAMVVCNKKNRHPSKEWTATSGYAFVRFTSHQVAKRALKSVEYGLVSIQGCRLRGTWAKKDSYSKGSSKVISVPRSSVISENISDILRTHVTEADPKLKLLAEALIERNATWVCSLCEVHVVYKPLVTPCAHIFCGDCLYNYILCNGIALKSCARGGVPQSLAPISATRSTPPSSPALSLRSPSSTTNHPVFIPPPPTSSGAAPTCPNSPLYTIRVSPHPSSCSVLCGVPFLCPTCQRLCDSVDPVVDTAAGSAGIVGRVLSSLTVRCPHHRICRQTEGNRDKEAVLAGSGNGKSAALDYTTTAGVISGMEGVACMDKVDFRVMAKLEVSAESCAWVGRYDELWEHLEECSIAVAYRVSCRQTTNKQRLSCDNSKAPSPALSSSPSQAFSVSSSDTYADAAQHAKVSFMDERLHAGGTVDDQEGTTYDPRNSREMRSCSSPRSAGSRTRSIVSEAYQPLGCLALKQGDVVEVEHERSDGFAYVRCMWSHGHPRVWVPQSLLIPLAKWYGGAHPLTATIDVSARRRLTDLMYAGGVGVQRVHRDFAGGGANQLSVRENDWADRKSVV